MKIKKILSVILAAVLAMLCLSACKKEEAVPESAYAGILTKVKLGMPLTKIISLQPDGVDLYYETDTRIWSINNDTELREITALIPEESAYYYVDDSIITYNFKTVNGDPEIYLNGYVQEVGCLIDRDTAKQYFADKTAELEKKYGEPLGTMTGTEEIDMVLTYKESFDCPSFTVVFSMQQTYDTVDSVEGYYGTFYSIEVTEKVVKDETAI